MELHHIAIATRGATHANDPEKVLGEMSDKIEHIHKRLLRRRITKWALVLVTAILGLVISLTLIIPFAEFLVISKSEDLRKF